MHLAGRWLKISNSPYMGIIRNFSSSRIIRIPMEDAYKNSLKLINEELLDVEDIKYASRRQIMHIYEVLSDKNIRKGLSEEYFETLLEKTSDLNLSLVPEDYAKIFTSLRNFPSISFDYVKNLNAGVQRLSANFTTEHIALLLRSYASIGSRSTKTISKLIETFNKSLKNAELCQIREVVSALATLRIPATGIFEVLYKQSVVILQKHLKNLNSNDIAIFVNSFVRQGINQDEILHFVEMHARKIITCASFKSMALIANAFARNERYSHELLKTVSSEVSELEDASAPHEREDVGVISHGRINVVDVAMIFNAFVKLEHFDEKVFNKYVPWLLMHIDHKTPTLSLVLLAHSYSQVGIINKEFFSKIAYLCLGRLDKFNCQQLGVTALAFAKSGYTPQLFFARIADEIIYRGTIGLKYSRFEFDFQSLEQLMQAFSRSNFKDKRLFCVFTTLLKERLKRSNGDTINGQMIASILTSMSRNNVDGFVPFITKILADMKNSTAFSTVAISKILSAFKRLQITHPSILEYFTKEILNRVNQFQPSILVNSVKYLAKLRCYNPVLIKETIKKCSIYLAQFTTYDISNIISALSDFGYRNVSFLKKLAVCINHQLDHFTKQQLHIIFTKLAILRTSDLDLYSRLIGKLLAKQHEFDEVESAEICLSYIYILVHFEYLIKELLQQSSTASFRKVSEFNDILIDSMLCHLTSKLDVATVFKIQTIHLYLTIVNPEKYQRLSLKAKELLKKCSNIKFSSAEYFLTSSSAHKELSHFLNLIGVVHKNEVQCSPYLIDIVPETSPKVKVAIEYDGPSHFYSETIMRTAKSILKHEILEKMGWNIIHVPYQEWAQLISAKQKIAYVMQLKAKLRLYEGCNHGVETSRNLKLLSQTRAFSYARGRKNAYLHRINEEILKKQLEADESEYATEGDCIIGKNIKNEELEQIINAIYDKLLDNDCDIVDIDSTTIKTKIYPAPSDDPKVK